MLAVELLEYEKNKFNGLEKEISYIIKLLENSKKETGFVIKYADDEKVKRNVASRYLGIRESQMEQLLDYIKPVNKWNKYLVKDLLEFKANNQSILQNLEG